MTQTCPADDFATIRARMEELRREREGAEDTEKERRQSCSRFAPTGLVRSRLPSGG